MLALPRIIKWILYLDLFFLALMSVLRLGTWWLFKTDQMLFADSISAFLLGLRFDARIIGAFSLVILLPASIPAIHPFHSPTGKRIWKSFAVFFGGLLILLYVVDFIHMEYLSQRLNATALSFLEDARISSSMVWQTYPVIRICLGILAGIIIFNWIIKKLYMRAKRSASVPQKSHRLATFFVFLLMFGLAVFGRVGQYPLRWSDAFSTGSDFNANLALNPVQSLLSSMSFRGSTFSTDKVKQYYPFMSEYLGVVNPDSGKLNFERKQVSTATGLQSKPNIVIVICESFSAYKSSMWGNPLNTTPFFNSLAKEGVFFDNCYTPHFGTARGVWATITGIPDVETAKTASRNPAMVDQHTIFNGFTGYEKFYFLGGSTSWANIRGVLTNNIKDLQLYEEDKYDVPRIDVWGISDKNLFLEANKVLKTRTSPFVAVIQTADNHRPYTISAEDTSVFHRKVYPEDSLKLYGFESNDELNAFRYTDFGFEKFIAAAKQSPYFNNTIFVFVGDHGIHGNAAGMFPQAYTDLGLTSYHVPLLFYAPKILAPARKHDVASQVDLLPTAAGLANINYTNTTLGRDLLATGQTKPGIAFIMDHNNRNRGVVKGGYYFTSQPDGKKEELRWTDFNEKDPGLNTDSLIAEYRMMTAAFYETARYMLQHNKKK